MTTHVTTFPESSADVIMSPPRERAEPTPDASTDASRLSFPLQLVIMIVSMIIAAYGAAWTAAASNREAQAQMQSDIRNILTRMDAAEERKRLEKDNLDLRLDNMKKDFEQGELRKALLDRLKSESGK